MKYKLYKTSHHAWDAMIKAIEGAQKSIYLEMYIFLDDTTQSHDFIGKLTQKAQAGLQVIVVADAFGSKGIKKETLENMKRAGIEFLFFSHWLRHIHRKIMIIDEKFAFMGGVNIGKKFFAWHDLQLKLHGKIAARLLKSFAYTYEMAGGKNDKILRLRKKKISYKLKFWLIEHWPQKNIHTLKNHYVEKITTAQKSIKITTPYFTPPRWLISLLDDAMRRGVEVEILLPKKADIGIMNHINYCFMSDIHRQGASFFLTDKMIHAKLLLIDENEGLVGSQNLDFASFSLNSEVGLFFKDKRLIKELAEIISFWKKNSTKFQQKNFKMTWLDYIIVALMRVVWPML